DPCLPNPCQHGGTCDNGTGAAVCACTTGWRGATCGDADPCSPNPCENDGGCSVVGGAIACACADGWLGPRCADPDPCVPNPCLHGGACANDGGAAACSCASGWMGPQCDEADPCEPDPCENDGVCSLVGGAPRCDCVTGWLGPTCADDDPCLPNPCANGGTCAADAGGVTSCACTPAWTGPDCTELRGGGSCDGGCDDGNFCTDDACDTATNTCTHVPSAAICAPPVTITNFTGLAGEVAFDGVGAIASDALSLNGGTGQTARARLLQPLAAGDDFVVTFGFQFSSASTAGGDGMSLVLEGSASAPLHGLMGGDDAVALAIRSGTSGADGGGSALVRLSAGGSVRGVYDASGDVTGGDFSNAGPHVVELRVVGGMATVALDDEVVIGPVTLDAAAAGAVDGSGRTWAAFVGVTGANAETHAVRSFSWTALCDTGVTCATTPTDYCDADVVCGYASASAKTCAQLGWSDGATWGSASVCARSAPGASCSGAVSWSAAVAFCEAAGARLCSVEELRADEARDSGCAYDDARVWSSTACGAMARTTLAGATTGVGNVAEACTGEGEATTAVARCCADTSPFERGVPSCDAAGCIEACAPDGCSGDPGGEPVSCVVEGDCAGACGPDAMGCTCITTPQQTKVCAPTCNTATDCPPGGPSGGWACTPMHFCVPAGGGPGGPGGPGGGGPGGGG
ncbi:MAG: hypothetical protein KC635_27240, partial [Myxococcales bacterium]|nr:hypothetical protein [Myxococcales bacterium]